MSANVSGGKPLSISIGLRRFLYATAALTGAAVLIVEILGAKMLSPYVGTSHFVWTAQITVTLLALACGYYIGGWWVDRRPRLGGIYAAIGAAGVYLALTSGVIARLAYALLDQMPLPLAALLASAILFFIPLTLLAAVGPFFIRILARSTLEVGGLAGRLTAVSTFGSVAGTLLISYVLIPLLPNSHTMELTAAALIGLMAVYFLIWRRGEIWLPAVAAVGWGFGAWISASGATPQFKSVKEIYRANSNFGLLEVIESRDGERRFYLNDFLVQNSYDTREKKSVSLFTYLLHDLATGYGGPVHRVLCIGLGVGIVPREFIRDGARVDVVEINPAVLTVAQRFFDFPANGARITFGDGRCFLNRAAAAQYDAVILDAFLGDSSPSHLLTQEAFAAMRRCLRPNGVLVINSFGQFEPGRDFFMKALGRTLRAVFPYVRAHVPGNGNVFFAASQHPLRLRGDPDFARVPEGERQYVEQAFTTIWSPKEREGTVLRDDYNPLEYFDAQNREHIRRLLTEFVREL